MSESKPFDKDGLSLDGWLAHHMLKKWRERKKEKSMAGPKTASWKPEFLVDGRWYDNAQRFATEEEAKHSALARWMVWMAPKDYRTAPSEDEVNCKWDDQKGDVFIDHEGEALEDWT